MTPSVTNSNVTVLVFCDASVHPDARAATLSSASRAFGPAFKAHFIDPVNSDELLKLFKELGSSRQGQDGWLLCVTAGDLVAPTAGAVLTLDTTTSVVYGDEDGIDPQGRFFNPWFKPEWDRLRFLHQDYVTGACFIRYDALLEADHAECGRAMQKKLVAKLLLGSPATAPRHIAEILIHRAAQGLVSTEAQWHSEAIKPFLPHGATTSVGHGDLLDLAWSAWRAPDMTVIIPTRDRAELLATCLAGLDRTHYPGSLEIIIIDNGSVEDETLELLRERTRLGNKVLPFPGPYNFSAMNNLAVEQANGEYVCLLNNDVEMGDPDWLSSLARLAVLPGAGAVGPRLLYADGTVQHAGVVIGIGAAAGHVLRGQDPAKREHRDLCHVTRGIMAVTAACLVVSKQAWLKVGGMDADALPVAFNDVDFCLKLEAAGYDNLYAGNVELIHHESKTRPMDNAPDQIERFRQELGTLQDRWHSQDYQDRFYHPKLTRKSEQHYAEFDG